jgi:myo-inositol-1(or 4)-monophosphatase
MCVGEFSTAPTSPIAEARILREILGAAGAAALERFRAVSARRKADGSIVTEADLEAQEIIAEGLSRAFPGIPIVAEEGGLDADPGRGVRFYVDPIDGTAAFVEGLAHWGPTVGLVVDDDPVLGALYIPRIDEFWVARRGAGAWLDGVRLEPRRHERVRRNDVLYVPSRFHTVAPRAWPGKMRGLGSTAVHLAQVAAGAGSAAVIARWAPWDVACGILLVEEANRVITDLAAAPLSPLSAATGEDDTFRGEPFLAGDPVVVELLASLAVDAQQT